MSKLTRLMILIAVAFLAVRPVMACCLVGHAGVEAVENTADVSPCHGARNSEADSAGTSDRNPAIPFDCPGCMDCSAAVTQAQSVEHGTILSAAESDIPLAALMSRFDGFERKPVTLKTGPPGDPPPRLFTPVTLKQRLLI